MTRRERQEREDLRQRWASGIATAEERRRCVRLDQLAEAEQCAQRHAAAVDPLDPFAPDLFYHQRRPGDARPAIPGLSVCSNFSCRRTFTPTESRQELCQRCEDEARGRDVRPKMTRRVTKRSQEATAEASGRSRKALGSVGLRIVPSTGKDRP